MIACIKEHLGCHAAVTIQQTHIRGSDGEQLREREAFAPSAQRGECLGSIYGFTGERKQAPKKSKGWHTMLVDEGEVIVPRHVHLARGRHPIASVNEPPPGHFMYWSMEKKPAKKGKPGPSLADTPTAVFSFTSQFTCVIYIKP